ncbi:MAG: sulfite exporter TauE/SafE family protein [Planctomycetota bacterium]|nr:MAG: sulfite exporter TauE/SafE family protein [Planctomycetota bacterium]
MGDQTYCLNLAVALPVSFVAGLASGMVGVGGGILKVPMMVLLFGVPMDIAVGCSALMVGITAVGGFVGHAASGHWDWKTSLVLAVAVFAGGQIGSRISIALDKQKLKKGFGWFLFVLAAVMVARLW